MDAENDKRFKEFLTVMFSVGGPVIKFLIKEAISLVKRDELKKKLYNRLDIILPDMPLGARRIMINNKKFLMSFQLCKNIEKYSMEEQLSFIKEQVPEKDHAYLMKEVGVTLSSIPNYYIKLREENKDFFKLLQDNLSHKRQINLQSSLVSNLTSTVSMFDDKSYFGLFIEEEEN